MNFGCPTCNKPEIDVNNDDSQIYFQLLDTLVSADVKIIITTTKKVQKCIKIGFLIVAQFS